MITRCVSCRSSLAGSVVDEASLLVLDNGGRQHRKRDNSSAIVVLFRLGLEFRHRKLSGPEILVVFIGLG